MAYVMDFRSFNSLNENLQKAKEILTKKQIDPTNPDFLQIQEWLKKSPGFIGLFTKFRFEDEVSMVSLERLHLDLIELRNLLNKLPKPVIQYQSFEELTDDIRDIRSYQKAKAFFNALLSNQKVWYKEADDPTKKRVDTLALELMKMPEQSQYVFLKKLARYKTLNELLDSLEGFLNQDWDYDLVKNKISTTSGAKLVYEDKEREFLVARIYTFSASKALLGDTSWCIKDDITHWNTHIGKDNVYNAQYSIWDFSKPFSDNLTRVGVTIRPNGSFSTAHMKDDTYINFNEYISELNDNGYNIPQSVFAPMTQEEQEDKAKYVETKKEFTRSIASKDYKNIFSMFKKGLSPFFEDGAIMVSALENLDRKLFDKLIKDYGYKPSGLVSSNISTESLEYIDYVISNNLSLLDDKSVFKFVIFLNERGCQLFTKYKTPLYLAITQDNLDFYKELLTKGYSLSDKITDFKFLSRFRNTKNDYKSQLRLASEYKSNKVFDYVTNEYPEFIKKLSDDEKNNIALYYGNNHYDNKDDIHFVKQYIEHYKFDIETVEYFIKYVIEYKDEELINKFLSLEGALNLKLWIHHQDEYDADNVNYTTALNYTISLTKDKVDDKEYFTELANKLFDLGAEPCRKENFMLEDLSFFLNNNDKKRFEEYLKRGGDINASSGSLLNVACIEGNNIEKVKYLLDNGAKPYDDIVRRFYSIHNDDSDFSKTVTVLLLKAGAEPSLSKNNKYNFEDQYYVLEYAEKNNVDEVFDYFYSKDIKIDDTYHRPLNFWLKYIIRNRKFDQLKKLVEKDKLDLSKLNVNPIKYAIEYQYSQEGEKIHNNIKLVEYLINHGAVIEDSSKKAIYIASQKDDLPMVKFLIEKGAETKDIDFFSVTYHGMADIFELILKYGNEEDLEYHDLDFCAKNGKLKMFELANKYQAKALLNKEKNQEYLIYAASNGHLKIIQFLERLGVDLNYYNESSDDFKGTALTAALKGSEYEVSKYLITKGAYYKDRTIVRTNHGVKIEEVLSPFNILLSNNKSDIVEKMKIVKYFVEDLKFKYGFGEILSGAYNDSLLTYLLDNGPELNNDEINRLASVATRSGENSESVKVVFNRFKDKIVDINEIGVKAARQSWHNKSSMEKTSYLVDQGADPQYIYDELKTGKNLDDDTREFLKNKIKDLKQLQKQKEREALKREKEQNKKGA